MKDKLYQESNAAIKPFEFDQRVVDVFPDMIKRSVPGYPMTLAMITVLADRYFQDNTNIYDLGCSLGAVAFALDSSLTGKQGRIIGVDNSRPMIESCQKTLQGQARQFDMLFVEADVQTYPIEHASVVVMNFTLQFIPLAERLSLLEKVYQGLVPGGILILSEKIAFDNEDEAILMQDLHHHMKAMNGYEQMEIANKREALEQVLLPETLETHEQRLQQAGFPQPVQWLRCLNFVSLLAIK